MSNITILSNSQDSGYNSVTLNKQFNPKWDTIGYNYAKYFTIRTSRNKLIKLDQLYNALMILAKNSDFALVRGSLVDNRKEITQAQRISKKQESGAMPTLCDEAVNWICIDIDKFPLSKGISNISIPIIARYIANNYLPEEFHDAEFILKLSSSAGKQSNWNQFSAHLFFWNERKLTCDELGRYFKKHGLTYDDPTTGKPQDVADPALFRCTQIIYTATPTFVGLQDPVEARGEKRIQMIEGTNKTTNLTIPEMVEVRGAAQFDFERAEKLVKEIETEYTQKEMPEDVFARIEQTKTNIKAAKSAHQNKIDYCTSAGFTNALKANCSGKLHYNDLLKMTCAFRNVGVPQHLAKNTIWACRYVDTSFTTKHFNELYANINRSGNQCGITILKEFAGT